MIKVDSSQEKRNHNPDKQVQIELPAALQRNMIMPRLLKTRLFKSHKLKSQLTSQFEKFPYLKLYPFLIHFETINHVRSSKVMFVMRGLPGSGKSTVAKAIKLRYKDAVVCSADNYFVKDDGTYVFDSEKLADAHKQCEGKARRAVERGLKHVIIDNTNIVRWEMKKYLQMADMFNYAVLVVEPRTPWKLDPAELAVRNFHNVSEEAIQQKMKKFNSIYPHYWGWFMNERVTLELLKLGETYFETCMRRVPKFASYMNELGIQQGLSVPVTFQNFYHRKNDKGILHCTSFFAGHEKKIPPETIEYGSRDVVQSSMGRAFRLKLIGIMITPRTVGIRISLNKTQLPLWGGEDIWRPQNCKTKQQPSNTEKYENEQQPRNRTKNTTDLPVEVDSESCSIQLKQGSRAHLTLGFSSGFSAVQTGLDQMELLVCEEESIIREPLVVDDATITYYGEGSCSVYFDWPTYRKALFTGKY